MTTNLTAHGADVNVVSGADEAYALPLATMLHSLLSNVRARASVHVYLMDGGFTADTRKRLTRLVKRHDATRRVSWMVPDVSAFAHLPSLPYLSPVACARLLLPDLLPDVDRALYVDADLIVRNDITALWNTPLQGAPLGAVQDFGVPTVAAPYGIRAYRDLGFAFTQEYFNSGVLLFDLAAWREQHLSTRAVRYLTDYAEGLQIADQEALNVAVRDRWHRLSPKWNLTTEFFTRRGAMGAVPGSQRWTGGLSPERLPGSAHIIHYTSAEKPWTPECDHPLRHLFQDYLYSSGWLSFSEQVGWQARYWLGRAWRSARVHSRPFRRRVPLLSRSSDI